MLGTNRDLIEEVFKCCDAFSLLSARAACKTWRDLASCDALWLRVLHDHALDDNAPPARAQRAFEEDPEFFSISGGQRSAFERFRAWCCAPLLYRAALLEDGGARLTDPAGLCDAVATARPGAVLLLEAGVYVLPAGLAVARQLTLLGRHRARVVLRCVGPISAEGGACELTLGNLSVESTARAPALAARGGGVLRLLSCVVEAQGAALACDARSRYAVRASSLAARGACLRGAGEAVGCVLLSRPAPAPAALGAPGAAGGPAEEAAPI
jgi:hypothetical protein